MNNAEHSAAPAAHLLSDYLSKADLAAELGITVRTITRWRMMRTAPPAVKFAGRVMFKRSDVMAWLESQREAVA